MSDKFYVTELGYQDPVYDHPCGASRLQFEVQIQKKKNLKPTDHIPCS